jgi:threonine/homoserine/homoserine lactone efflux protein
MIISIIVGFILGFILAIPPGPVAVTAMKLTLEKGAKHGKMVAFGTSIIDIFFALITVFATSFVVKLFSDITNYNPLLFLVFQILVCFGFEEFNLLGDLLVFNAKRAYIAI